MSSFATSGYTKRYRIIIYRNGQFISKREYRDTLDAEFAAGNALKDPLCIGFLILDRRSHKIVKVFGNIPPCPDLLLEK